MEEYSHNLQVARSPKVLVSKHASQETLTQLLT